MRIRGIHMTGDVEKSLKYRESQCLGCFSLKIDNPQCSSRPHTKTSVQDQVNLLYWRCFYGLEITQSTGIGQFIDSVSFLLEKCPSSPPA